MTNEELRRRREETQVEIRKAKREDSLNKRRNIVESPSTPVTSPAVSLSELRSEVPRASQLSSTELAQRLPDMVQALYSPDVETQLKSAVDFRKILAKEKNAPIQEVVDCGVVPRFVEILAGRSVAQQPTDVYVGQSQMHFEYRGARGPSFNWLYLSFEKLRALAAECGWRCFLLQREGSEYLVELRRDE